MFMANKLVIAFIYAISYRAEVIYNLMEESPRRGTLVCLIVPWGKEENSAPKKRRQEKRKKE